MTVVMSRKLREQVRRRQTAKPDFCPYAEEVAGEAEDALSDVERDLREELQSFRSEIEELEQRLESRLDDIEQDPEHTP